MSEQVAMQTVECSLKNPTTQSGSHWIDAGLLEDIPLRGSRQIIFANREIALFRTQDHRVFAVNNACPHEGGPLSEGIVHGNCVTCPLHNWNISLSDGSAQGADKGKVHTYPIRVVNERVQIFLPS